MTVKRLQVTRIKEREWVGSRGLNVMVYHIHQPSLNTMNCIFPSKNCLSHHANTALELWTAQGIIFTAPYSGIQGISAATPAIQRQRRIFKDSSICFEIIQLYQFCTIYVLFYLVSKETQKVHSNSDGAGQSVGYAFTAILQVQNKKQRSRGGNHNKVRRFFSGEDLMDSLHLHLPWPVNRENECIQGK